MNQNVHKKSAIRKKQLSPEEKKLHVSSIKKEAARVLEAKTARELEAEAERAFEAKKKAEEEIDRIAEKDEYRAQVRFDMECKHRQKDEEMAARQDMECKHRKEDKEMAARQLQEQKEEQQQKKECEDLEEHATETQKERMRKVGMFRTSSIQNANNDCAEERKEKNKIRQQSRRQTVVDRRRNSNFFMEVMSEEEQKRRHVGSFVPEVVNEDGELDSDTPLMEESDGSKSASDPFSSLLETHCEYVDENYSVEKNDEAVCFEKMSQENYALL